MIDFSFQIRPLVNQVECHPYLNQEKLLSFCQEQEIQLIAYSPLGSPGRLWADKNEIKLLDDDAIKRIAKAHNKTPAQVLLRWQVHILITNIRVLTYFCN